MSHPAMKSLRMFVLAITALALAPLATAVPDGINYQAYLTNADGTAVNTTISITFAAYNVDIGGVPLWSQTDSVAVDQGLFSVTLANPLNPFPAGLFDTPVYIGLFVAGEEMLPRRELTSAAFSFKAADADTLNGVQASTLDQSADVASLQSDVAGLDGRIGSLEATGADITGVSTGPGLTGGGTTGDVVVSVANGGINAAMLGANSVGSAAIINGSVGSAEIAVGAIGAAQIAANAVGTSELAFASVTTNQVADGSLQPQDLNSSLTYTVGGLINNGNTQLNGSLAVTSGSDIIIRDDFNGFRWYSGDGTQQFGAILMRDFEASFYDATRGRYAIYSTANGIGIGTTLNNTGYAVSVPSLSVAGQTNVGLERVFAQYSLNSTATCHAHGNLTCYYGTGSVSCPVGKRVLGGGSSGSNARYGHIGQSFPGSNTTWTCSASYDLANNTRNCYALCARLE